MGVLIAKDIAAARAEKLELSKAEQQVIAHLVREHQQQDQQRTGAAKR
ncbi:MAG: hypothetical protein IJH84_12375 [Saccharopolyspora sp.]|nr:MULTISPECIES: hypothetical protein [unclassified Saccharopolyspora]MBK0867592.1 hypothetical protein [Saccharopolyspora sp. HNM0986]MBQ6641810.1 hypothetical protein [Saccharopolyspora sp.]